MTKNQNERERVRDLGEKKTLTHRFDSIASTPSPSKRSSFILQFQIQRPAFSLSLSRLFLVNAGLISFVSVSLFFSAHLRRCVLSLTNQEKWQFGPRVGPWAMASKVLGRVPTARVPIYLFPPVYSVSSKIYWQTTWNKICVYVGMHSSMFPTSQGMG